MILLSCIRKIATPATRSKTSAGRIVNPVTRPGVAEQVNRPRTVWSSAIRPTISMWTPGKLARKEAMQRRVADASL
jgi:hypothetical protein